MSRAALPTALTAARLAIGGVLLLALPSTSSAGRLGLAVVAALTDFLDGYLARRWRTASAFGAAFDLATDGVFFLASFVALWRLDLWPAWLLLVVFSSVIPEAAAQIILVVRTRRFGSPGRFWNRVVGGYAYVCVFLYFGGATSPAWAVALALIAWGANIADVAWALRVRARAG